MPKAKEIKKEMHGVLFAGKWLFRMAAAMAAVYLAVTAIVSLLDSAFEAVGVKTLQTLHWEIRFARLFGDEIPALPSGSFAVTTMIVASLFEVFIAYIVDGVLDFGSSTAASLAVRNRPENYFGCVFSGFKRPFGMAALRFLVALRVFLWSLLFIVPGIIAAYRYSMAFFIKADDPDKSASECLEESGRLMKGRKWRLFCLQCSYWPAVTAVLLCDFAAFLLFACTCTCGADIPAYITQLDVFSLAALCFAAVVVVLSSLFLWCYTRTGNAVFYRHLTLNAEESGEE
ncbi:MAG: DUF975 family protein [Kiritimatiellae bacterium]|nr:DUF975 family protein [Kiritimatiellia bacterium]